VPGGRSSHTAGNAGSAVALWVDLPWLAVLFVATFWNVVRQMGTSPTIWIDTLFENQFIDDCLVRNQCTIVGPGATIGIFHSAGYLHWRALIEWLGFNADGTYRWLLTMNVLGVVLVALAARRLAGPAAAAIAAVVMVPALGVPTQLNVISDVAPVPFLGAVFLLAAVTTKARPSLGMTALLGMVAGVMANVYATGLLCGLSAVWVALLIPQRRWTHALVAAAAFALTTFVIAPATWLIDAGVVLSGGGMGNANASPRPLRDLPFVPIAALAAGAWAVATIARSRLRRHLDVPAAVFLPLFIPLVALTWIGRLDPQDKYLSHVIGAVAVGIAVPIVVVPQQVWGWAVRLAPPLARLSFVGAAVAGCAPYVAAACIAYFSLSQHPNPSPPSTLADLKFHDLVSAQRVLVNQRGWGWSTASRDLRAADEIVRLAALYWVSGWPQSGEPGDLQRAYLLKPERSLVPQPPPANVVAVRTTGSYATLLVFASSWIDWGSFRVCVTRAGEADSTCTQSGLPMAPHEGWSVRLPGMPIVDAAHLARQTMRLHLPLRARAQAPEEWIYMPRLPLVCSGRIVSVDGGTAGIEESGRWARLRYEPAAAGPTPRELVLEWELGGPGCSNQYRGYPPFFIEGDPASVTLVIDLLKDQLQWP